MKSLIIKILVGLLIAGTVVTIGVYSLVIKPKYSTNLEDVSNVSDNKIKQEDLSIAETTVCEKIDEMQDYVYEKEKSEINETTRSGYTYTDVIRLPFINLNSEDVQEINGNLEQEYQKSSTSLKRYNDGSLVEFGYITMDYKYSVLEEKLISLQTESSEILVVGDGFDTRYITYNLDINTGKKLSNLEVLEMLNISTDKFTSKMYEGIKNFISSDDGWYGVYSINDFTSKFNMDTYQIFIVNENQLELYFWCNKDDWHEENEYNVMITLNL